MSKVKSLVAAALTLAVSATVSKAALSVTVTPVVEGVWSVNSDGTIGSLTNTLPNATTVANGTPAYYDVHFLLTVTGATPLTGPAPVITLGGVAFGLDGIGRQPTYLGAGQPTQGLSPVPGATTIGYTDITGLNSTTLSTPAGANGLFEEIINNGDGTFSSNDFINSATAGSIFTGAAGDQGQHNLLAMAFEINAGKINNTQKTIGQASAFDLGDAFI